MELGKFEELEKLMGEKKRLLDDIDTLAARFKGGVYIAYDDSVWGMPNSRVRICILTADETNAIIRLKQKRVDEIEEIFYKA